MALKCSLVQFTASAFGSVEFFIQINTDSNKTPSNVTFFPSFIISLINLEFLLKLFFQGYRGLLTNESLRFQAGSDSVRLSKAIHAQNLNSCMQYPALTIQSNT